MNPRNRRDPLRGFLYTNVYIMHALCFIYRKNPKLLEFQGAKAVFRLSELYSNSLTEGRWKGIIYAVCLCLNLAEFGRIGML